MKDPHDRFSDYLQRWWTNQHAGQVVDAVDDDGKNLGEEWRSDRDVHALASQFRRDTQFEIAQAGLLHRRLSPFEARDAVDRLDPLPTPSDAELLTDALVRASSTAQRVRTTTAVGAVVTVSALVLRNILRRRS